MCQYVITSKNIIPHDSLGIVTISSISSQMKFAEEVKISSPASRKDRKAGVFASELCQNPGGLFN